MRADPKLEAAILEMMDFATGKRLYQIAHVILPNEKYGIQRVRAMMIRMAARGVVRKDGRRWFKLAIGEQQPKVEVVEQKPTRAIMQSGQHHAFSKVMMKVKAGVPVLLVGPAGSGKTYLAAQIADALGLPFTFNSMSEGVSESSLLGRTLPDNSGNWVYKPAPFVTSYENGGVHLLDEIDAADPNLLVQINAAIANGRLSIPFRDNSAPIMRHQKSIIIAAANTFGNGADRQYVGRNQLDAATVNRFTMGTVEIDYDRNLEAGIVGKMVKDSFGKDLLTWAWSIRDRINANKLRRLMSTRNIEDCAKLYIAGESFTDIRNTYFAGWTTDEKQRVMAA